MKRVSISAALTTLLAAATAQAQDDGVAAMASMAFARHCFSPFMTAEQAAQVLSSTGARVDFYDLSPRSNTAVSPVIGRPATPDTDRRCEVAFDGDYSELAASAALTGLDMEGIGTEAPLPGGYEPTSGTHLLAARQLNPARVAVVHVGTRPGPNGVETFVFVERLTPQASGR